MERLAAIIIFAAYLVNNKMTNERAARIRNVLDHRQPDLTVLLENVHDPHNISAVMRSCDSVGIQEIYILNTRISKHAKFGKKSSASAANWLTIHQFDNTEECFTVLKQKYTHILATHLGEESKSLYEVDLTAPVALVFGNEHSGVSEEVLKLCNGNFIIPQVGMVQSLNISVACAVSLYEAFRQRHMKGFFEHSRLPTDDMKILEEKWGLSVEGET
jgi:tRNA (guanosine-2'-O-)-methyltransferase